MSEAEVDAGSLPSGVRLRSLAAHTGLHGSALDLYDPSWGVHDQPLVYAHVFTVRPGTAKGWGRHERHDDRYALLVGSIEIALCDTRPESPTCGLGVVLPIDDTDRRLVVIPRGVWHATRNTGAEEALIADFPTEPYAHEAPDKFSLPLDTDELPLRLGPEWVGF
jgi:dTDP-4-dehydrorhamnose 3,5-epimerase